MIVNVNEYEKLFDEWIVSKDDLSSDILIELKEKAPDEIKELFSKLTAVIAREDKSSKSLFHSLLESAFKIGTASSGNWGHSGRPGLVGGSAPRKHSVGACKEWRNKVNANYEKWRKGFDGALIAAEFTGSIEEVKTLITKWLREGIEDKPVKIRVDSEIVEELIKDGRFKTQFETKTSKGAFMPHIRKEFEKEVFGIPKDATYEERPIYGYITEGKAGWANQYGDAVFILKERIKNRTSVTFGDSLDINAAGEINSTAPTPLTNANYLSVEPHNFLNYVWWGESLENAYPYTEAQIFGGVDIKRDVKEVIFTKSKPTVEITEALQSMGIHSIYDSNYESEHI